MEVTTSITIGDTRIDAVLDATGPFYLPVDQALPDATRRQFELAEQVDPSCSGPDGIWSMAFRTYVVRRRDMVMVVDTGAATNSGVRRFWAPHDRSLAQRLNEELDIEPDSVTHVVLTHLHGDHGAGCLRADDTPAFGHASYLVQEAELASVGSRDMYGGVWSALINPLLRSGQLMTCVGGHRLHADGSSTTVRLVPAPGHTAGHQGVRISTKDELAVLAGDAFVHAVQLIDPGCSYVCDSHDDLAAATRRGILDELLSRNGWLGTAHLGVPFIHSSAIGRCETTTDRPRP